MRIGRSDLVHLGKQLYREIKDDDLSGAAAELAFRFFLALFPFFIFLTALGGFVASATGIENPTQEVMDTLGRSLPADAESLLRREIENVVSNRDPTLVSLGIVGAIWAASSGIGTIMKTTNRVYGVRETRPLWKRYALAVSLTVVGGALLIAAFVVAVIGEVYGLKLATELGVEGTAATALKLGRWPVVIVLSLVASAFLYWAAPDTHRPFRWITPGAVLFSFGWVAVSFGFGLFIASFGSYNATYGALGGVVIVLTWFYLTSFILLAGAELNAVLAEAVPGELPATADEVVTETLPEDHGGDVRPAAGEGQEQAQSRPSTFRI